MITDVHRIVVKRNNVEIKTNTLLLTFNTPHIPDYLKICYLHIPVTQYVPNPFRCYKCQRFGHVTGKCKHSETCARFAQRLDTRTTYAPRNINVLTVEKTCIIQQKVQEL